MAEAELASWRGRQVGVVFQFFQLLLTLSIAENLMLPMDFCRTLPRAQARRRALAGLIGNLGFVAPLPFVLPAKAILAGVSALAAAWLPARRAGGASVVEALTEV